MKAKLIFKLPDEKYEYRMATKGINWYNVAWDMYQYLRSNTKYAPDDAHDEYLKAMQECKDELFRIMDENNVDFDL